jgi:signal transduction histidine kinase
MWHRIAKLLTPSTLEDTQDSVARHKARVARPLYATLLTFLGVSAGVCLWQVVFDGVPTQYNEWYRLLSGVSMTVLSLGLLWWLRRGHVYSTGVLLSGVIWVMVTLWAFTSGGVRNTAMSAYVLVIIVAGLTVGGRAAILAGVACVLAGAGAYFGQTRGLIPVAMRPLYPFDGVALVLILGLVALLLYYAARSTDDAFERARSNEQAMAESNRALQHEIAERELAEGALRENERFLAGVFEGIQDGISVLDLDLNIVRVNQRMETMYSTQMPLVGRKCYEVYQQRSSPCPWCPSIPTIQTGEAHTEIVPYPSSEQPSGWIELSSFPTKDHDGNVVHIIEHFRDITERKASEEALQQRNRELETLTRASQVLSSSLDLDQVLEAVLEEVRHLLGVTASSIWLIDPETDEVVCRQAAGPASDVVRDWRLSPGEGIAGWVASHGESVIATDTRADDRYYDGVEKKMGIPLRSILSVPLRVQERLIGTLQILDEETDRFDTRDKALLESLAASAAVAIENARLYRELHGHADQLDHRVQERTAELETQYARLDAILRSTNDGVVLVDAEGNVIQANSVAQAWLTHTFSPEHEDAEVLQQTILDLARQAEQRPESVLELTGIDLELRAAPVVGVNGLEEPIAAVINMHDVSHLKEVDRLKSAFIDNIAHELRTPMTTIRGYAYLMQRTSPDDEKWDRYLQAMLQQLEWQAQLFDDILQISRIYAGRVAVKLHAKSLNELAQGAVERHHVLAHKRGVNIEFRPSHPDPLVMADTTHLMRTLNNLVGDALRYTPPGGSVSVDTGTEEAEGRTWATISVSDSGERIPAEDHPHVFDRFSREQEPLSSRVSETGLRLMILKGIVELHRGRVTMRSPSTTPGGHLETGGTSKPGVGSTFTVWLPVADQGGHEENSDAQSS